MVSGSASAQLFVDVKPAYHAVQRPPQPGPNHVWVDEEWQPKGKKYRYTGGHWETSPHTGYVRTPGHWQNSRRGNTWIRGSWRKK
ncbi:hypothetical protein GCM10027043_08940 [Ferruginibacter profundus]